MQRRDILSALGATAVPLAGCINRTPSLAESDTATPTVSCPPDKPDMSDISVSNWANQSHSLTVTVTKNPGKDDERIVYERSFELPPGTHESEDDPVFPEPGEYRTTVSLETGESDSWNSTITDEDQLERIRHWASLEAEIGENGAVHLSPTHAEPSMEYQEKVEACE